jgi:uncharacterized protein YbaA (DUF1428 family)
VKTFSANPLISNEATLHNPANPRRRVTTDMSEMPFDGKRMIYGGFKAFLEL